MRGLLKSNFYNSFANSKVFAGFMVLAGVFVTAIDNTIQTLLIGYMQLAIVGFSVSALENTGKEYASKWGRYQLTAPVTRAQIVAGHFISHLGWLAVGAAFGGIAAWASFSIHGFPFDRGMDLFLVFVMGGSISLLAGAAFFPLYYLGGDGFWIVGLLFGVGASLGLVSLANLIWGEVMSETELMLAGIAILACSALAFGLSYPLTVRIFRGKDI